jgi:YVTN family beta-propeller protein
VVAVGSGCNFGQNGTAPPVNRIFLPAGVAVDPDADFLYVVNSNSDLRYNAGTVVAVDLQKMAEVRAARVTVPPPVCGKTRFSRTEAVPDDYCCRDTLDSNIINCNEPAFIQSDATIEIGSFGGAIQVQRYPRGEEIVRRLYVSVRAEPSITFADVTVADGKVSMRCTGPREGGANTDINAFCEDSWRIRRPGGATVGEQALPEEPHVMSLDNEDGILFVGHLTVAANGQLQGGGISSIDVCDPGAVGSVRFAGLAQTAFLPDSLSQAVATLASGSPSDPAMPVFATARYSTAISGMVLRHPEQSVCNPAVGGHPDRDLTLIVGESFRSSAFLPNGADIRGILFSDDGNTAFILHRNDSDATANPAALVAVDRRPLADGTPANAPMDVLEVCSGPTGMVMHDAGRGERIFVTCYDAGQIYVVDPVAFVVTATIEVGAGPTNLVFSPRDPGTAYVASFANSHLSVVDFEPGSPTENRVVQRVGLPHGYGE